MFNTPKEQPDPLSSLDPGSHNPRSSSPTKHCDADKVYATVVFFTSLV